MTKKLIMTVMLMTFICGASLASAESVYHTKNGKKYHKEDCLLIKNKKPEQIEKGQAQKIGLVPCKKCFKEDLVLLEDKNKK